MKTPTYNGNPVAAPLISTKRSNIKTILMKKILLLTVLVFTFSVLWAAYFKNLPYTITQPDGKTINCFVTGDEFYNWIHDANGYTIIQAPNGYYYYAEQVGDLVQPSKYLVNSVDPGSVGLSKWIKVSKIEYKRKKSNMLSYQPAGIRESHNVPYSETINNLVFYIRFSDDDEFTTTRESYDNIFNPSTGITLKSYFKEVSYDKLTISSTHYPACGLTTNLSYQDSHPRSYFQPYNATTNPTGYTGGSDGTDRKTRESQLLVDAINWININSPVSSSLNLDGDNDGSVDNVCFVIKGGTGDWGGLLWAHKGGIYSQTVNINGKIVMNYILLPENQMQVRTLCHEMFHVLGSPDMYHYTNQGVISPVGYWDLMEYGSGHMLAYMKWKYTNHTWINAIPEITTTGTYSLNPLTSSTNNCYKIASPYSTDEYFIVEYRNKSGTFESNIPGSGLIIYRIDNRVYGNSDGPPDEVYVYRPNGTKYENGNPDNAYFSSTVSRTAINDDTDPSSFLQSGGPGALNISNINATGTTMSFNVTFPNPSCTRPTTQASAFISSAITNTTMTTGWTRGNGTSVLVFARQGSAVNAVPVDGTTYTANAAFGSGIQIGTGNYVVYKGTGTSVNLTGLTIGTTYHYAIYEYNSASNCYLTPALVGNVTTTGYCPAGATDNLLRYISRVKLGTIDQTSTRGTDGYEDHTLQAATMQIGVSSAITVNVSDFYHGDSLSIWVDWNKDNDFLDEGEKVYSSLDLVDPYSTSFTPPDGATIGATRMRMRLNNNYYLSNSTPCGNSYYGEVEDYTINVTAPNPPSTPTANPATSIVQTSFTANWGSVATATGYRLDVATNNSFTTFVSGYNNKDIGNVTSSSVTGLSANTTYYYRIRAYNTGGTSPTSGVITTTTLPDPPAAPTANPATSIVQTSFTANWNTSTTATGYRLDVATNIGFTTFVAGYNDKDVSNVTTYSVTGLSANTTYFYRVRAYNTGGTSPNSGVITTTTLPDPPAAPTANPATSIVQTSLTANWSTSATATGYRLDVATNIGFTSFVSGYNDKDVSNVTNFGITGLSASTTYFYRVRAYNTGGASPNSGTITTTTTTLPDPPAAPTTNPATSIVQTSLTANWSTSATATGYRLDVATNVGFTAFVSGFNDKDVSNVTNFGITGLSANTTYFYRVRAYNTGGTSPNSGTITTTTLPNPPAAPTANPASSIVQTSFTANWNASATATGYRLDVATNSGFTAFVAGYNDKDVSNVTSHSVTGLSANTTYYYRLRAYNTGGASPNSGTITTTTLPNPPAAPTANPATSIVQTSFTANCNTVATATGYRIDVATNFGFTTFVAGFNDKDVSNVTTFGITGLSANTTYYYRLRAYNTGGASPNSSIITVTTLPNPPAAPTTKPATNLLQTSFTANWNASATATGYRLDVATNSGFTSFVVGFNDKNVSNVTTISVTGLSARTQYYFRVRGYNTGGIGTNSISLSVTTLTNPPAAPIGLTASSCNNLVTLKWRKNSDPYFIRYRIYGGLTNNPTTKIDSTSDAISDTTKIIYGLTNGQTYYLRVTAVNYDGPESVFSVQSSATVKTGVIPNIKVKFGSLLICYNPDNLISNYQWYNGSTLIPNAVNQYYSTGKLAGNYRVETIDKDGCKNTSDPILTVVKKSLVIYPNPASVSFALEINDPYAESANVTIINSAGAKVMEFNTKNTKDEVLKSIPVNNLANGVYVVKVLLNNKDLYYTKIVVLK